MIAELALLILIAIPLLLAAYSDYRSDRDQQRRMPVAVLRQLPLKRNVRR